MAGGVADGAGPGAAEYNLLQQQLVAVRARLDRQISQLIRLNELSDELLHRGGEVAVAEVFAEAVLDVLDVAAGAVWVLPSTSSACPGQFTMLGADAGAAGWPAAGAALAEWLGQGRAARRLTTPEDFQLDGAGLVDPLVCRCASRDGTTVAVVLAANTVTTAGNYEPVGDETSEMLALLADKVAAHIDNAGDQQVIRSQLELLAASEERLGLVLEGTNDGWWDWDVVTGTCFMSARWNQMLGHPAVQEQRAGLWLDRVHPADLPSFEWALDSSLDGGAEGVECEVRLLRADGDYLPVLVRGSISRGPDGSAVRFAGSILDLSERKRHEEAVHRLAFYDPLTDLPNRRLLVDRLSQELLANRRTGQTSALLMLDLDRFKTLNDTHGHAAGDELLRSAARRLRATVRSSDTVARLSGDEFVVLLTDMGQEVGTAVETAEKLARQVLFAMDEPYSVAVGTVHHSASIGVAVTTAPELDADTLLKQADVALYEAKGAGRNTVRLFEEEMQQRVDDRSELDNRLHAAFDRGELAVVYQPQVDASGALVGAEALMRWFPADGSAIGPDEFIPVAEESGFIHVMGAWLIRAVCEQIVAWREYLPEGFRVAVNLSAPEFLHPDLPERILETLERTGVSGSELRLEITEATVVTELEFVAARMDMLRAHGIEFSLDDFGTGYSSLTYLRRLPVSEVKIDKSYVSRFLRDHHDEAIVRAVLTLCQTLNLRVVAEGVEQEDQLAALQREGCEFFQGYLFGLPQPPLPGPAVLKTAVRSAG